MSPTKNEDGTLIIYPAQLFHSNSGGFQWQDNPENNIEYWEGTVSEWEEYYDQQTDQDLLDTTESWLNSPHPISLGPLDDQTEHADAEDDQDLTTQLDSFEETTNEIWNDSPTSPLEPIFSGDWLTWLASRSKLKQLKERELKQQQLLDRLKDHKPPQEIKDTSVFFSTPHEEIIVYPNYEKTVDDHEYILKYDTEDQSQEYVGDTGSYDVEEDDPRTPFLLSDLNTRDILYYDIVEQNSPTTVQPISTTATTTAATTATTTTTITTDKTVFETEQPGSYEEVVNQNNQLVEMLHSTLEMQAYILDKIVSFFIK